MLGRSSHRYALIAKSAKPDAAATIATSLTAREKVALFCAAADRGLIERDHAARYSLTDEGPAVPRAMLHEP